MVCSDYSYTLTSDELLARVRQQRAMEPVEEGFTRIDSTGALDRMRGRLRALYMQALATLDPAMLPLTELAAEAMLTNDPPSADGTPAGATLPLPARCMQPVEVRLTGWHVNALLTDAGSAAAAAQRSPFSRAGCCAPVAVRSHGGTMRLYPATAATQPESLLCVAAPASDDIYLLTPQLEQYLTDHYDI